MVRIYRNWMELMVDGRSFSSGSIQTCFELPTRLSVPVYMGHVHGQIHQLPCQAALMARLWHRSLMEWKLKDGKSRHPDKLFSWVRETPLTRRFHFRKVKMPALLMENLIRVTNTRGHYVISGVQATTSSLLRTSSKRWLQPPRNYQSNVDLSAIDPIKYPRGL